MVRKVSLSDQQMPDGSTVNMAAGWADSLLKFESRGPGDLDNAMRRLARKTGVPYATFWKLRYRRPADVFASVYFRLRAAYEAECARQMDRLAHEVELTRTVAGAADPLVLAAEAVVAPRARGEALSEAPPS